MAGAILQPLLIIKINTKGDYLVRRSSVAPPDAPVNSYKAIRATFAVPNQALPLASVTSTFKPLGGESTLPWGGSIAWVSNLYQYILYILLYIYQIC